jgi:hypothetical protein
MKLIYSAVNNVKGREERYEVIRPGISLFLALLKCLNSMNGVYLGCWSINNHRFHFWNLCHSLNETLQIVYIMQIMFQSNCGRRLQNWYFNYIWTKLSAMYFIERFLIIHMGQQCFETNVYNIIGTIWTIKNAIYSLNPKPSDKHQFVL